MPDLRRLLPWMLLAAAPFSPALAQAPPDDALAAALIAICAGATPGTALADRCAEVAAGGPGSRDAAAGGNAFGEIPGQGRAATRDGAPGDDGLRTGLAAGWALFASAETGRQRRRGGINEAPFDGDTGTLTAGVDWQPSARWQLALLASHSRDDLDFTGSDGRLRTRFSGALLVAGWRPRDMLSIDAYAGRLGGDYRVRRVIDYALLDGTTLSSTARATIDADRDLAGVGATWSLPAGAWEWQLGAGIDWQRTDLDPYTETGGAGWAIAVPARSVVSRRSRLDATLARTVSASWGVWQPLFRLGWRHEGANPARPLSVTFVQDPNGTPVAFATDDPDTVWGEAAIGATFVFAGGHSAFAEWRGRFGHAFLDEHALAIGWRMELP